MSNVVLNIENVSKQYRLGVIGTGTLSHDLNRWWHRVWGKEDPYAKIGAVNDRSLDDGSTYVWALKDINFKVKDGDVLGIIGKNGAGKSTLLKLLSQVTNPTTGKIEVKGRIASLLEVGTGFHPELTGRENIYLNGAILGMTKVEVTSKLDEIVDFAGVARYIDTPVKRYSSGMKVRLGFAVAAHLEPEILVVDEVLAVGDAEFQKKCIGKMKDVSAQGRTVLFVSHNMTSIKNLCQRAIVLEDGKIKYDGGVEDAVNEYLSKNTLPLKRSVDYDMENNKVYVKLLEINKDTFEKSIDKINILFVLHFGIQIVDSYFGLRITDRKENEIIFSSTDEMENDVLRNISKGEYGFQCKLPTDMFKPGLYYVSFTFRGAGGEIYHKEESALRFYVADNVTYRGIKGRYRKNSVVAPTIRFEHL